MLIDIDTRFCISGVYVNSKERLFKNRLQGNFVSRTLTINTLKSFRIVPVYNSSDITLKSLIDPFFL